MGQGTWLCTTQTSWVTSHCSNTQIKEYDLSEHVPEGSCLPVLCPAGDSAVLSSWDRQASYLATAIVVPGHDEGGYGVSTLEVNQVSSSTH